MVLFIFQHQNSYLKYSSYNQVSRLNFLSIQNGVNLARKHVEDMQIAPLESARTFEQDSFSRFLEIHSMIF